MLESPKTNAADITSHQLDVHHHHAYVQSHLTSPPFIQPPPKNLPYALKNIPSPSLPPLSRPWLAQPRPPSSFPTLRTRPLPLLLRTPDQRLPLLHALVHLNACLIARPGPRQRHSP